MRCLIYARFSPRKDSDKCESIPVQADICQRYSRTRGFDVWCVAFDRDWSGGEENRPGLWFAIEHLRKGDVLVAYRPDRLARNLFFQEYIWREVGKLGARIECCQAGNDDESPEGILMRQILGAIAEYERRVTAARTSAAMLWKQRNGQRISAVPPYGWKVDSFNPRRLVEDPEEQGGIALARILRDQGKSYRAIGRALGINHITVKRALTRKEHQS